MKIWLFIILPCKGSIIKSGFCFYSFFWLDEKGSHLFRKVCLEIDHLPSSNFQMGSYKTILKELHSLFDKKIFYQNLSLSSTERKIFFKKFFAFFSLKSNKFSFNDESGKFQYSGTTSSTERKFSSLKINFFDKYSQNFKKIIFSLR